jgi:flavin-dependent dehydrogenase
VTLDAAVVGGGPAGLAAAIALAQRGARVAVFERGESTPDKACGEGLLPPAVRGLERLGVLPLLAPAECARFDELHYVQEDGSTAVARLPRAGMGVRRLDLSRALGRRADALGVARRSHCSVHGIRRDAGGVVLELATGVRHGAGLDRPAANRAPRRFGVRRHFRGTMGSFVEIHVVPGAEAYLTPVGDRRVGVAFLWADGAFAQKASFDTLLARFPRLQERFAAAEPDSEVRGAGPFLRHARARVADRLVLIGDAAGYVDAISGEGLSLAFSAALTLGELWPTARQSGCSAESLQGYERAYARRFAHYARVTGAMVHLARHPASRRMVVRWLGAHPGFFDRLVAWGLPGSVETDVPTEVVGVLQA